MKKSYGKRFKQTCLAYFLLFGKLFKFALSIIPMDIMLSDKEVRVLGCLIEKELSTRSITLFPSIQSLRDELAELKGEFNEFKKQFY